MRYLKIAGGLLTCSSLLLSGCISMTAPKASTGFVKRSPVARQAILATMNAWHTTGAFSVQYQGKADIARFVWDQAAGHHYYIRISSALSLYQLQLQGRPGFVSLIKQGQQTVTASTPEALLQKTVGWYLPVSPLQYWYKGMPAPSSMGHFSARYDQYGHLVYLQQAGWGVSFLAYRRFNGVNVDLPQVIKLKHAGLSIKIVTKLWRLSTKK